MNNPAYLYPGHPLLAVIAEREQEIAALQRALKKAEHFSELRQKQIDSLLSQVKRKGVIYDKAY